MPGPTRGFDIRPSGPGGLRAPPLTHRLKCVTVDAEVEGLIAAAVDATGRLDVLVSAAGIAASEDEEIESPDLFRRVLAVNTTGSYTCARGAAAVMVERGSGSIVNVASISGLVAGDGPDTPSYAASKGAVVNLTRELAVRWRHGASA